MSLATMNSLQVYFQIESRATITNGNWINPTYLPSTRSAQRIKLPEIIAARESEITKRNPSNGENYKRRE